MPERLEDHDGVTSNGPVGNVYDKYHTRNPIARWLMRGFLDAVTSLAQSVQPRRVLEVGCGEGYLSLHLLENVSTITQLEACDLSLDRIPPEIRQRISFRVGSIYNLPYDDDSFDLVVCCEVLEHLTDPESALSELTRVTQRSVLLSTPREPLWRILNLARGRYWSAWGNTPGHIQHFSSRSLRALSGKFLQFTEVCSPIPWAVILGTPLGRPNHKFHSESPIGSVTDSNST